MKKLERDVKLNQKKKKKKVLCCTLMTHLGDLEVKVTDFEILCFWLKILELYIP